MSELQSVMTLVMVLSGVPTQVPVAEAVRPTSPVQVAQAASPKAQVGAPPQVAKPKSEPAKPTPSDAGKPDAKATPPTPAAPAPKPGSPAAKAPPMTAEVKALVDRMQRFYEATEDFRADFTQVYTYKTFKRKQTSSGKVTFKKPGLMRWDYEKPSARSFVLAGTKVYAHDPEAKTLTVAAIDTSQLSASVTFLFGQGKLQDEFAISKGDCKDCKGTLLILDPLVKDPRFRQVRLEVDPKTAQVRRSIVIDPDGSENAITFGVLQTNQGVDRAVFKLTPPADTQVMDYTRPRAK